jgi:mannitol/fructose-specific phosphotransferase system IIA component (Ntr-type)
MILEKIISIERVKIWDADIDKWAAIDELADLISSSSEGADRDTLIDDVLEREYKGSTGIGKGIAIPHARTTGVKSLVGALGISEQGIDFESDDGGRCHMVFLILAPPEESTPYLKALSAVAFIGKDEAIMSRLTSAASPGDVISVLDEVESGNH